MSQIQPHAEQKGGSAHLLCPTQPACTVNGPLLQAGRSLRTQGHTWLAEQLPQQLLPGVRAQGGGRGGGRGGGHAGGQRHLPQQPGAGAGAVQQGPALQRKVADERALWGPGAGQKLHTAGLGRLSTLSVCQGRRRALVTGCDCSHPDLSCRCKTPAVWLHWCPCWEERSRQRAAPDCVARAGFARPDGSAG